MALLAGHLDFPPAPGRPQLLLALGAAEVFVGVPFPKAGALECKPLLNGRPEPQKAVVLPLPGGVVAGEHAEEDVDENGVSNQGNGPEKGPRERDDQRDDQQEQAEFVPAVAAVHKLLELLKQQQRHILSTLAAGQSPAPSFSVYRCARKFSTGRGKPLR